MACGRGDPLDSDTAARRVAVMEVGWASKGLEVTDFGIGTVDCACECAWHGRHIMRIELRAVLAVGADTLERVGYRRRETDEFAVRCTPGAGLIGADVAVDRRLSDDALRGRMVWAAELVCEFIDGKAPEWS